ncbi:MAG: citrate synthase family protein [Ktedonobacteraceae bacterium]|nr:citrate synthase family protein [Ktedonobacteraceae bacterium]MBO0795511.1 citrate synthase family protein [Ktedonobacteraceae bacterium]
MKQVRYLTAREAAEALHVSLATLYTYVSRGLIRSEPANTKNHARLYAAEDIQRLIEQKTYRHDPSQAASNAIYWGIPILESELTLIDEDRVYYRGQEVLQLATSSTFEQIAALLWTGELSSAPGIFAESGPPTPRQLDTALPPAQRLQVVLAAASASDLAAYDLDAQSRNLLRSGARILKLMAATLAGREAKADETIVAQLRRGWQLSETPAEALLRTALILCADHELNASSFAARIVASTSTNLYQVVIAGLAALQGFKHGGQTLLVENLLRDIPTPEAARPMVAERIRRGEGVPGFGHRLYPQGDPRARLLLGLVEQAYPTAPVVQRTRALATAVREITGREPVLDVALVTLAGALQLPGEMALALFALGRTAGWIGHAIEQYNGGQMIRPRAKYVGPR